MIDDRILLMFWGKKERPGGVFEGEAIRRKSDYHPLVYHLVDVATVTGQLWQSVVPPVIKDALRTTLGCMDLNEAAAVITFLAAIHDLGKALPDFQLKWAWFEQQARAEGFPVPPLAHVPHASGSTLYLQGHCEGPVRVDPRLATVLGGHHGIFPIADEIERLARRVKIKSGYKRWITIINEIVQKLAALFAPPKKDIVLDTSTWHGVEYYIAGLVSVSDWIASMEHFFPFTAPGTLPDYSNACKAKATEALAATGLTGWSQPGALAEFGVLFDFVKTARPLQQATIRISGSCIHPGMVLIEAPMGEGKTEAALYLADAWGTNAGSRGIYFALPTQATSDQMYGRVEQFLEKRYPGQVVSLNLVHGHASLSAEFQERIKRQHAILHPTGMEEYPGYDGAPCEVVASEWFTYKKRGLLCPFGVGTIDQALLGVLQTRHFFVRLFGLAGKVVIFDEVHAYDVYMSTLLELLLEWLAALHSPVILLSATLPSIKHQSLMSAYARGLSANGIPAPNVGGTPGARYPRMTWLLGGECKSIEIPATRNYPLAISQIDGAVPTEEEPALEFPIGALLRDKLVDGGCVAILCNTVKRAQSMFKAISRYMRAAYPEVIVELLHAHFTFEDRNGIEKKILSEYGKPDRDGRSPSRPLRSIVVATQVIEQSLDLDFDFMVTDLAPVDLMLQRAGRMHRHDRYRPKLMGHPELCICLPQRTSNGLTFGIRNVDTWIYDEHVLLRTWLSIMDVKSIAIPGDVERLIEGVYSPRECPEDIDMSLRKSWAETRDNLEAKWRKNMDKARKRAIYPACSSNDVLESKNLDLEEDDPTTHVTNQALTRISGPSIPVVLSRSPEVLEDVADETLLMRSLKINHFGVVKILIGEKAPPSWAKKPLLRHHRLLQLDPSGSTRIGTYAITYDKVLGLTINMEANQDMKRDE